MFVKSEHYSVLLSPPGPQDFSWREEISEESLWFSITFFLSETSPGWVGELVIYKKRERIFLTSWRADLGLGPD